MWRNTDVDAFLGWMRAHNDNLKPGRRAGFYGLDLYNMSGSISAVLEYLDKVDPDAAAVARERYACLTPWQKEPSTYGRAVLTEGYRKCEQAVIDQCRELLQRRLEYVVQDGESFLDAAQNARLIASAERYYRIMYYGGAESWNLRDTHMFETLGHLLEAHGPQSKAVVWAHNSHIGDARYTEMGVVREELNIGQLCRERFGDQAALIGFGTHTGTVAAASDWGGDMEIKRVRPSHRDSYERALPRCRCCALPARPRPRSGRPATPPGAATGAVHRRYLPARYRTDEPLRQRVTATAIRCLRLVRRNLGGDAARTGARQGWRARHLSVRPVGIDAREGGGKSIPRPRHARRPKRPQMQPSAA